MDVKKYKKYHEEYMTNNTGTTVEECVILLSVIPLSAFVSSYLNFYIRKNGYFILEFVIIILPVVLNCTILSDVSHIIFLNFLLLSVIIIFVKIDINSVKNVLSTNVNDKKSFLTNFRASTNFVSAICILAVDFKVFPKRLAKTESFGWGFMDLGVGFFICSNGFVEKHKISQIHFTKMLKTELILCVLGLIRLLSVKAVEYHEHVSEYGVHWNFFFTLALCRFLSYLIILLTSKANLMYLSITTGFIHQFVLSVCSQEWVLSDKPRDSFISANREGLASCLGYVCLYFASSAIGKYILHSKSITYKKLFLKLFLICILSWIGTTVSFKNFDISRRLVNIGYIFWILSLSLTEVILFVVLEISLLSLKKRKNGILLTKPSILESINSYGLFFFIFSNLLTGLVNSVFQTLLLEETLSMIIIISYMIILCSVTCALQIKKFSFNFKAVNSKKD